MRFHSPVNHPGNGKYRLLSSPLTICFLLAIATFVVYWPVTHHGFIDYDDDGYFFGNPHVLGGLTWANIQWAFTSGEYDNWHPLTWLSLMLDAQLFGKGATAPHVTSVLLHAANAILVFCVFRQLTGALWRSATVTFLFALHPLHVESVAWVAERKDVLSAFFGLLTLWCYSKYAQSSPAQATQPSAHSSLYYSLALVFFACGLMAKPMLVTIPFVLLLLDFWPLQRFHLASFRCVLVEKIPFFLLSAVLSVVTYVVQDKGGAVTSLSRFPLDLRLENTFVSYGRYLGRIFLPLNLATPYSGLGYWPAPFVIFCVAIFLVMCVIAVALRKKCPFVFTGWFWYAGMLVPVIGLVQVGSQAMADRYTYLPFIGILVAVVWGIAQLCLQFQIPSRLCLLVTLLLFLVCGWRARNQVAVWQDDGTLFGHALAVTKNNYVAALDLGYWYAKNSDNQKSLDYYHEAEELSPGDPTALYDTANAFAKLGHLDEAISVYRRALQITPDDVEILNNLGFALAHAGQLPDATKCFQAVIKLKPNSVEAHNNLATLLFMQGDFAGAQKEFKEALQVTPNDPTIIINLGDTYLRLNDRTNAIDCFQHALQLQPANRAARAKLQSLGVPPAN